MAEWQYFVAGVMVISLGVLSLLMKTWIKASIEKDLQAKYDLKIEQLKADLRLAEEQYKSTLKLQEADKTLLRSTILTGTSQRQSLIDKRRIEAVEGAWNAVIAMLPLKGVCHTLSNIPFKEVLEMSAKDVKIQKFFNELLEKGLSDPAFKSLRVEQLFLTPLAWAYLSTYNGMIVNGYTRAKILIVGFKKAADTLDDKPLKAALIAAPPAEKKFIEENDVGSLYNLLDLLESKLLEELRSILEGRAIDEARVEQASHMLTAAASLERQNTENSARVEMPASITNNGRAL